MINNWDKKFERNGKQFVLVGTFLYVGAYYRCDTDNCYYYTSTAINGALVNKGSSLVNSLGKTLDGQSLSTLPKLGDNNDSK